ncbi:MAG: maleylpyruvate isomerase family mycothiol-dependent enzyme [Gordonia sp. (in: high G+C Gram-positive bacteria)]
MTPDEWLAAIRDEGAAFASIPTSGLAQPVPTCPGWDVADLVAHLGGIHRWVIGKVTGVTGPRRPEDTGPGLLDWYAASLQAMLEVLESRDPDAPAATFVGQKTVAFWLRRQAHEIAVHRYDADTALRPGAERPIAAGLAADGVDEWLGLFAPRFLELGDGVPEPLVGATLQLSGTDVPHAHWHITVTPDALVWERIRADAAVEVTGGASDLELALWHRRPLAELPTVGDAALAATIIDLIHVT